MVNLLFSFFNSSINKFFSFNSFCILLMIKSRFIFPLSLLFVSLLIIWLSFRFCISFKHFTISLFLSLIILLSEFISIFWLFLISDNSIFLFSIFFILLIRSFFSFKKISLFNFILLILLLSLLFIFSNSLDLWNNSFFNWLFSFINFSLILTKSLLLLLILL